MEGCKLVVLLKKVCCFLTKGYDKYYNDKNEIYV